MKRWNGWGREDYDYHLPESATIFLEKFVGKGEFIPDALLENVLKQIPDPRIKEMQLLSQDKETRLRHACGQSLPDWICLRHGTITNFPDAVVYPTGENDIQKIINFSKINKCQIIPYGGGSSVVGHLNIIHPDIPTISVDMEQLNQLHEIDSISHIATFGSGIRGPDLEDKLASQRFRFGHYPQSHEFSTLGGWIASRSVGTQCYYYGRIEQLFLGGTLITPEGILSMPVSPASAAGPDLKHFVLGSEGRLGIISKASVRISPLPENESFYAIFFRGWEEGFGALKDTVQKRIKVSMLRLLDAMETETSLQLAGKEDLVKIADKGLRFLGYGDDRCLLIFGLTGLKTTTKNALREIKQIAHQYHGIVEPYYVGKLWYKSRFTTPYLRNTLWDLGYALDTLETAFPWAKAPLVMQEIEESLRVGLEEFNEKVLVFSHLSHMYTDGASIYVTYLFRRTPDPEETLNRWKILKHSASEIIVRQKGTISHQHGIGVDHTQYLLQEKGALGMELLRNAIATFDPQGIMNKGKLIMDQNE